jgi:hypothetical protein
MDPVPKMMGLIKKEWNPETQLVSFKLETDMSILAPKALNAIKSYGVDMVIANILSTRRNKVTIFHKDESSHELEVDVATEKHVDSISSLIVDHITNETTIDLFAQIE